MTTLQKLELIFNSLNLNITMIRVEKHIILFRDFTWAIGGDTYDEAFDKILHYEGEKNGAIIFFPGLIKEAHKLIFNYDNPSESGITLLDQ